MSCRRVANMLVEGCLLPLLVCSAGVVLAAAVIAWVELVAGLEP